ncbi:MAG: Ltp family lipoprotein [Herbinix sp.]|nr:Ltp family lipoprotein [Herbinix sp.]
MAEDQNNTPVITKKKFYNKPLFWVIAVVLFFAVAVSGSGDQSGKTDTVNTPTDTPAATSNTAEQKQSTPEPAQQTETVSQKNAVNKAKSYLDLTGFSRDGLVAQLEYDKFSNADAFYGADNAGADWSVEAEQKAKSYMEFSSFSRQGLIDQLVYEKFTIEQATHGADSVGL